MADSPLAHSETLAAASGPEVDTPVFERLVPGTCVGNYEIERYIGAGAMGEVYAAKEPVIAKAVAIKVMRGELLPDPDAAIRMFREARAANQVDHPNVVDVFAHAKVPDGRLCLIMDLIEGRSLRAAVRDKSLDVPTSLDLLDQIADALDAAHARGVVHRDLKPDNVMISEKVPGRPRVHVLDFGLAKIVQAGAPLVGNGSMTGKGTWIGTPGYMAPEQWSADGAGPASDRYALGVMAFEMLSGQLPFQAPSLPAMMEQHFRAEVPALSARGAINVNARLDPVLARAMAKNPEERFPTARALVQALRDAAAGKVVQGLPRPKRSWVPAAAGVGVLAVSVGGVLLVRNAGRDGDGKEPSGNRDNPPPTPHGEIQFHVTSTPAGARLYRAGAEYGRTPADLTIPAGESIKLEARKAGYKPGAKILTPKKGEVVDLRLEQIVAFEGVWVLPDGQLRALSRADEAVLVYKVDTVAGERVPYMRLDIVESREHDLAFSTEAELTDDRHPDHPTCKIKHKVEYHYDRTKDHLEVQPDDVATDVVDGKCIIRETRKAAPMKLVRADRPTETRWSRAPVGKPDLERRREANEKRRREELERQKTQLTNDEPGKVAPDLKKPDAKPVPAQTTVKQPADLKAPPVKAPPTKGSKKTSNDDEDDEEAAPKTKPPAKIQKSEGKAEDKLQKADEQAAIQPQGAGNPEQAANVVKPPALKGKGKPAEPVTQQVSPVAK
jgi:serine/threonine-protein kinase